MKWYAISQLVIFNAGIIAGFATNSWEKIGRAVQIFLGNFYLDENDWSGGIAYGFLRHTWEMLQTLVGNVYSQIRNMGGAASRVDYMGGATFVTNENSSVHDGITFGYYVNINIREKIYGDFDTYATTIDPEYYLHEYGHTIDSRIWGPLYLPVIAAPSGISALMDGSKWFPNWKHSNAWTEKRANRLAADYFKKHYGVVWNDVQNPR